MAVYLNTAAYHDNTYCYEAGRLRKMDDFNGTSIEMSSDVYLVVQPGDLLVVRTSTDTVASEVEVDLWGLVVDTGLTKWLYKNHQMYLDNRFLNAIAMYYTRDGYADLTLVEFVGKVYGLQQGDEITPSGRRHFKNRPNVRYKVRRVQGGDNTRNVY